MSEGRPVCDIPPIHGKSAKDTRAGRSAAVDMAEPGDTLEKIAADELARILKLPEVLLGTHPYAYGKRRSERRAGPKVQHQAHVYATVAATEGRPAS